jgi:hypothetical protein
MGLPKVGERPEEESLHQNPLDKVIRRMLLLISELQLLRV